MAASVTNKNSTHPQVAPAEARERHDISAKRDNRLEKTLCKIAEMTAQTAYACYSHPSPGILAMTCCNNAIDFTVDLIEMATDYEVPQKVVTAAKYATCFTIASAVSTVFGSAALAPFCAREILKMSIGGVTYIGTAIAFHACKLLR